MKKRICSMLLALTILVAGLMPQPASANPDILTPEEIGRLTKITTELIDICRRLQPVVKEYLNYLSRLHQVEFTERNFGLMMRKYYPQSFAYAEKKYLEGLVDGPLTGEMFMGGAAAETVKQILESMSKSKGGRGTAVVIFVTYESSKVFDSRDDLWEELAINDLKQTSNFSDNDAIREANLQSDFLRLQNNLAMSLLPIGPVSAGHSLSIIGEFLEELGTGARYGFGEYLDRILRQARERIFPGGVGSGPKGRPNVGGDDGNMFIGTPGPPGGSGNIGGTDRWVPGGNVYFPENGDTGDYGTVLGDPLTKPDPPVTDRGDNKTGRKRDN